MKRYSISSLLRSRIVAIALGLIAVLLLYAFFARVDPDERSQRIFAHAQQALRANDVEQVRADLTQLEENQSHYPQQHYLRGALLARSGKFADAYDELQLAQFHPDIEVDCLTLMGQIRYQTNRTSEAIDLWQRVLALDKNAVNAHRWLGVYYHDIGAMENARIHLEKVASLAPNDGRPHRLLGLIFNDYQMYPEAIAAYRESIKRDRSQPDQVQINQELAKCEIELNNYEGAMRVIEECPPTFEVLALRAECALALSDLDTADELSADALLKNGEDLAILGLRARVLLQKQDVVGAEKLLQKAVELHPSDFGVRLLYAQALQRLGRVEESKLQSEKGTALRDQWTEYNKLHKQAIASPYDADIRNQIGEMAVALGQEDLAKQWFHAALQLDPTHATALQSIRKLLGSSPPAD